MVYGVVHTTNLSGCDTYSFQATSDIENGALVTKGDLVNGERDIYVANTPATVTLATEKVYLVANPAWDYDECKITNQNEENYINKAGVPFRVYDLKPTKKFRITNYSITGDVAEGKYVGLSNGSSKMTVSDDAPTGSAFIGVIRNVDTIGFPYAVGSGGEPVTVGSENMGYAIDNRATMVTIEVVKNG